MAPPARLTGNDEKVTVDWKWRGNPLLVTTPPVLSTAWRTEDGRIAIPMVNITQQEQTVTLQFDPAAYGMAADAQVTVQRIGPETTGEAGRQRGAFAQPVRLAPLETCALIITPA